MGERYGTVGNQATNTTTSKTMLVLTGSTTLIFKIYDFMMGCDGTPADGVFVYEAQRTTAAGTSTSATPEPLDVTHALVAEATAGVNHTAEPTTAGSIMIAIPANARASYRWQAAPGGELWSSRAASNGFAFRSRSPALTLSTRCTVHHEE